jgi:hypothetical protein
MEVPLGFSVFAVSSLAKQVAVDRKLVAQAIKDPEKVHLVCV